MTTTTIAVMATRPVRERMGVSRSAGLLKSSGPPSPERPRHRGASRILRVSAARLFAHLDDQTRLAGHMQERSAMMGGGHMAYSFDDARGTAVGSRMRMTGTAFGLRLSVEEVVTVRDPPHVKIWRTVDSPKLLIIGAYEMGFRLAPASEGTLLTVWINYALPPNWLGRLLGRVFASLYARWCVERMVTDAANAFPQTG